MFQLLPSVYMSDGKVAPFLLIQLADYTYQQSEAVVQRYSVKKLFLKFRKFTGKHLCQSLFFNKLQAYVKLVPLLRPATLLKKRLWHRCFPMNFAKFLRTPFLTEHLRWLLLSSVSAKLKYW